MPFESKSQWRKCWAMKRRGEAGSWDCKEWADSTKKPFKKLPESKPMTEKEAFDNMVRVKTALYKLQSIFEKVAIGVTYNPLPAGAQNQGPRVTYHLPASAREQLKNTGFRGKAPTSSIYNQMMQERVPLQGPKSPANMINLPQQLRNTGVFGKAGNDSLGNDAFVPPPAGTPQPKLMHGPSNHPEVLRAKNLMAGRAGRRAGGLAANSYNASNFQAAPATPAVDPNFTPASQRTYPIGMGPGR